MVPPSHRRPARRSALLAAVALLAACSGGSDDPPEVSFEPIVSIDPCDLLSDDVAADLAGAEVGDADDELASDGTATCSFAFADDDAADAAGSSIAASLSIGPGQASDVPGGSIARSLDLGDASAVVEEPQKVQVVYIVETVVVVVEVAPGSGEVTPEQVEAVIEFAETTEAPITEAVTGQPFVADTTTTLPEPEESTTTTFVQEEVPDGDPIEIDGASVTATVERPGGITEFVFEGDVGDIVFLTVAETTITGTGACVDLRIVQPDGTVISSNCAFSDRENYLDRTVLQQRGLHQIVVDPRDADTATLRLALTSASDTTGSITIDGDPVNVSTGQAGALGIMSFDGIAGDVLFLTMSNTQIVGTGACIDVRVRDSENFVVASNCAFADRDSFIDRIELPETGRYTIEVDPRDADIGSLTLLLTNTV